MILTVYIYPVRLAFSNSYRQKPEGVFDDHDKMSAVDFFL